MLKYLPLALALFSTGCVVYEEPVRHVHRPVRVVEYEPAPQAVVSIYVEPPIIQPRPIACPWAPPPMLVEVPPPMPFNGAVWTGGYWVWEGDWVWAHGRWSAPPRTGYRWVHPYYENRDGLVVFITGHWAAPGIAFVPPPPHINIDIVVPNHGVVRGLRPVGPPGVFVPAPPGSRLGLIVPAPLGTPPSVVTSAPPIVNTGMRIHQNINSNNNSNNTTIINNHHVVNNITNVTIVAPPSATASGRAVNNSVSNEAHVAAALPPVVKAHAPQPINTTPVPAFTPGRVAIALPPAQTVKPKYQPSPVENKPNPQQGNPSIGKPAPLTPNTNSLMPPPNNAAVAKPISTKPTTTQNNGIQNAQPSPPPQNNNIHVMPPSTPPQNLGRDDSRKRLEPRPESSRRAEDIRQIQSAPVSPNKPSINESKQVQPTPYPLQNLPRNDAQRGYSNRERGMETNMPSRNIPESHSDSGVKNNPNSAQTEQHHSAPQASPQRPLPPLGKERHTDREQPQLREHHPERGRPQIRGDHHPAPTERPKEERKTDKKDEHKEHRRERGVSEVER